MVIEEEVVLDTPKGVESVTLSMPFYGKATVLIYRPLAGNCQWTAGFTCFTFSAGDQSVSNGCCNVSACQAGSTCFTSGNWSKTLSSLPMGTAVSLLANRCVNGNWIEEQITYQSTSNPKVFDLIRVSNGCKFGLLTLIESTPPDCPQANGNNCLTFHYDMPPLRLNQTQPVNDLCTGHPTRFAYFKPVYNSGASSNLYQIYENSIEVCFNKDRQFWNFKILEREITISYNIVFCLQNITNYNMHLIETNDIQNLSNTKCEKLKLSLSGFDQYPVVPVNDGYVFSELYEAHESAHKDDWNSYVESYKYLYEYLLFNYRPKCDSLTISQVKQNAIIYLQNHFATDFYSIMNINFYRFQGLDESDKDYAYYKKMSEHRAHTSNGVKEWKQKIKNEIIKLCGNY